MYPPSLRAEVDWEKHSGTQMAMLVETLSVSLAVILIFHLKRASISILTDDDGLGPHQDEVCSANDAGDGGGVSYAAVRNHLSFDLHHYCYIVSDLTGSKTFYVLHGPQYLDDLVQMALDQGACYCSQGKAAEPL